MVEANKNQKRFKVDPNKGRQVPEYPSRLGSKTKAKPDGREGKATRQETEGVKNKERKAITGFKMCVCVCKNIYLKLYLSTLHTPFGTHMLFRLNKSPPKTNYIFKKLRRPYNAFC